MMNFQDQMTDRIQTNAPSIRYEGDLRPEQAGIMQQQAQAMQQMQQQGMMQQQQPQQPMMQPQMGQPQGRMPAGRMPAMAMGGSMVGPTIETQGGIRGLNMPGYNDGGSVEDDANYKGWKKIYETNPDAAAMNEKHAQYLDYYNRTPKAYGGIMGMDGRKQYGIGSWFQEKIMDPIKNNKALAATAAAIAADYGFNDGAATKASGRFIRDIFKGQEEVLRNPETNEAIIENGKTVMVRKGGVGGDIMGGLAKSLIPATGGLVAGMFSDKLNPPDEEGNIDYGASMGIKNIGQAANLLDQKQGLEAGLRFLPKKEAREFSPEEMAIQYGTAEAPAIANLAEGGISQMGIPDYGQQMMDPNMMEQIRRMVEGMQAQGMGREEMEQAVRMQVPDMSADMSMGFAEGGPLGEMGTVMEEGEEMLDMNGMEKDYREDGGFVPIGEYEKKDDVPARLSVNEFVFTADAVRGAGDGDVDKGAERLQGIMKQLEQQGRPEGMEMLDVSERLSEVV
jgi:hypothetical protein